MARELAPLAALAAVAAVYGALVGLAPVRTFVMGKRGAEHTEKSRSSSKRPSLMNRTDAFYDRRTT